jgi:BirA family biotin operon repressor/biotin-[acetyl-CoA-carboxylase] ligase
VLEDLDAARVQALLTTRWCGRSLRIVEQTASTNDDARAASLGDAPHGHVIVADHQTQGRGSRGRTWSSPAGTDLYLSVVLRADAALVSVAPLTLAVGVAVAEAIGARLPTAARVEVKWPNDVLVDGRKIAGILVECSSLGERALPLVVGIGINVNRLAFPPDLDFPATSVALAAGVPLERAVLLAELLGRIELWVERFAAQGVGPVVVALNPRLAMRDSAALCDGRLGIVRGISPRGGLLFETDGALAELLAGTLRAP